jgi:hypothetical protein
VGTTGVAVKVDESGCLYVKSRSRCYESMPLSVRGMPLEVWYEENFETVGCFVIVRFGRCGVMSGRQL